MVRALCIAPWILMVVWTGRALAVECPSHDVLITDVAESIELGEGHALILWKGRRIDVDPDTDRTDHRLTGFCSGMVEIFPNGEIETAGYCIRTDGGLPRHNAPLGQQADTIESTWPHPGGAAMRSGAKSSDLDMPIPRLRVRLACQQS